MFVSQSNNQATGDVVAGSKTEFNFITSGGSTDELTLLYAKLRADGIGDPSGNTFCEKLQHYMAARTEGDVRGLQDKLEASDRLDQLQLAKELKEFAAKSIMRRQGSQTAQRIFTIVLDELHTNFTLVVTPAIQTGVSRREVDLCISQALQSTKGMLGENVLELTLKDLFGLLFFLGGNCHIRWDKC